MVTIKEAIDILGDRLIVYYDIEHNPGQTHVHYENTSAEYFFFDDLDKDIKDPKFEDRIFIDTVMDEGKPTKHVLAYMSGETRSYVV